MEEITKHGQVGLAAMRAGVDRKTARKYVKGGKLPSELAAPRSWRTHEDAFLEHWPELEVMLGDSPALEAKTPANLPVPMAKCIEKRAPPECPARYTRFGSIENRLLMSSSIAWAAFELTSTGPLREFFDPATM